MFGREHQAAVLALHPVEEVRRHPEAAVGEDGVVRRHLHGREQQWAATEGELRVAGQLRGGEAERRQVPHGRLHADVEQHADGDRVLRSVKAPAHRHGALEAALVARAVFGFQLDGLQDSGHVPEDGGRRNAVRQRRGVDERLEAGAGLALGLQGVVELVGVEIPPADHGAHAAGARVQRHQGALHVRHLREVQRPVAGLHVYHVAGLEDVGGS